MPAKPAADKGEPPGPPGKRGILPSIAVKSNDGGKQETNETIIDAGTADGHSTKTLSATLKGPLKEAAAVIEQALAILQEPKMPPKSKGPTIELLQALQHMAKAENNDLDCIRKDIQLIKEKVSQTSTWAEIVAKESSTERQPPNQTRLAEIQERNRQQKADRRKEQAKYEVTLTAEKANEETKARITTETHEEITERCKLAVLTSELIKKPLLQAIQKLKSGDLRVRCDTVEDAQSLRTVD